MAKILDARILRATIAPYTRTDKKRLTSRRLTAIYFETARQQGNGSLSFSFLATGFFGEVEHKLVVMP